MTNSLNEQTNLQVLGSLSMSSRLQSAYPSLTEKGLVVVFAGFLSFAIHISEYIHWKQQR